MYSTCTCTFTCIHVHVHIGGVNTCTFTCMWACIIIGVIAIVITGAVYYVHLIRPLVYH